MLAVYGFTPEATVDPIATASVDDVISAPPNRNRLLIDGLNPRLCWYKLTKSGSADRLIDLMGSEQRLELFGGHGPAVQIPLGLLTTEKLEELDLLDAFHA